MKKSWRILESWLVSAIRPSVFANRHLWELDFFPPIVSERWGTTFLDDYISENEFQVFENDIPEL